MSEEENLDKDTLRLISERARTVVDAQLESIRSKQSFAGTIIGVVSLFLPFFLNYISESGFYFKFLTLLPFSLFLIVLVLMLLVLTAKPIGRTMRPDKFEEMVSRKVEDAYAYDISYSKQAFNLNIRQYNTINERYNIAVWLTIVGVVFSTVMLFVSNLCRNNTEQIQKIEIVTPKTQQND